MRKISYGVGVERIFLTEAPSVTKVEIKARGHVRRARLYYLRDLRGKKARLRSKVDKGFTPPLLHTIRGAGYMIRDGAR